jgi:hypothetical protein
VSRSGENVRGRPFINVLLDLISRAPVRRAAAIHPPRVAPSSTDWPKRRTARFREIASAWHMLMKGSIVSAAEGNKNAARNAKRAARLILDGWVRKCWLSAAP